MEEGGKPAAIKAKFKPEVKESISNSKYIALEFRNDLIETEHVFLGMLRTKDAELKRILSELDWGVVESETRDTVKKRYPGLENFEESIIKKPLILSEACEKVLKISVLEARTRKTDVVCTTHVLLSILRDKDNLVSVILKNYNVDYEIFSEKVSYYYSLSETQKVYQSYLNLLAVLGKMMKKIFKF